MKQRPYSSTLEKIEKCILDLNHKMSVEQHTDFWPARVNASLKWPLDVSIDLSPGACITQALVL